jgi:outer membrane lipoprotein-sorting protein
MSKFLCFPILVGLLLGSAGPSRADDSAEAKAILDRAVKAVGDQAKLKELQAATWKGKGKFYAINPEGMDYMAEWAMHGTKQYRHAIDFELMGQKFRQTMVVNGDKGWIKLNDMLMEMNEDGVAEQREQMFSNWHAFAMLASLNDKQFELSTLGETEIEKRKAMGIRAASKGHRDLNLYFDKETGLPLKGEWRVKDVQGVAGGNEVTQEVFLSDYKDVDGMKIAMKAVIKWDGKLYVDAEFSNYKLEQKLDDDVFAKP